MGRNRIYSIDADTRTCSICVKELPIAMFAPNRTNAKGYIMVESRCYECQSARRRKSAPRATPKTPRSELVGSTDRATIHRLSKYNLTLDQYNQILEEQEGCCAVCYTVFDDITTPHIDHCHSTGAVRGLLCRRCNTGIGMLGDDIDGVTRALDYLRRARNA